jgi:hypothetical protein
MRLAPLAILSVMLLGHTAYAQDIQIALDGAADLSPVYPTSKIPANAGQLVVLFSYGDQQHHFIHTEIIPITAAGKFTMDREAQTEVIAFGAGSRFLIRHFFIGDLPVGRWRLTVAIDNKPFGSQEFEVVPATVLLKLSSPVALVGSLANGSEWTSEVRAPYEPRPGLKVALDGITKVDSQGWLRTTLIRKVVSLDPEGSRTDIYRTGKLNSSVWTIVTDKGIVASKAIADGEQARMQPPEVIIAWPVTEFHTSWRWHDKRQKPELGDRFEMWGPLPVKTPDGEAPGYVVLQKITDEADSTVIAGSIETQVVPGLGMVYTASVQSIPQYQTAMRIESRVTSMKHGSGPEPEIRKYADLPSK